MHLLQSFVGRYASVCNVEEAILMTNIGFFYSPALEILARSEGYFTPFPPIRRLNDCRLPYTQQTTHPDPHVYTACTSLCFFNGFFVQDD